MRFGAVELVPFRAAHLDAMDLAGPDRAALERAGRAAFVARYAGKAMTGMVGGRPLGCGGLERCADGAWLVWLLLSDEMRARHKVALVKIARWGLGLLGDGPVRATVATETARRFAAHFGFRAARRAMVRTDHG